MKPITRPALLAAAFLLAACGQKGPLFLPGSGGDIRTEVPAPDDTDSDERDDNDEQPR